MANSDQNVSPVVNPYAEEVVPLSRYGEASEVSSPSSKELVGDNVAGDTAGRTISRSVDPQREHTQRAHGGEPTQADIAQFMEVAQKLERELQAIVIGQEHVIRELLLALLAGGHVLLEGVPGLG